MATKETLARIRAKAGRDMIKTRRILARNWLAVSMGAITMGSCIQLQKAIRQYEAKAGDLYQETRGTIMPPDKVIIVAIDDFSLQQAANSDLSSDKDIHALKEWPWPRKYHGLALERLIDAGASIVSFDLLFDTKSSHGQEDDRKFAEAIRKNKGRVVLASHVLESKGLVGGLSIRRPTDTIYAELDKTSIGLINAIKDSDGSVRKRPSEYSKNILALTSEEGSQAFGDAVLNTLQKKTQEKEKQNTEEVGMSLMFYGPHRTIKTIPIWQVLERSGYAGLKKRGVFKNAIVLIGPTALTMQDFHKTAFSGSEGMPGVEIHATEIGNRLEGRAMISEALDARYSILIGILVMAYWMAAGRADKPVVRLLSAMFGAAALIIVSFSLVAMIGRGIELTTAGAFLFMSGLVSSAQATVKLQVTKYRLKKSLERYLSPMVAAEVMRQEEQKLDPLDGKTTEVAVLITDIRRFTEFTKQMSAQGRAKEAVAQLNEYLERVIEVAHKHGGTIDKFIGDSALIVFGAPISRGNAAEAKAAIDCAEELSSSLAELNKTWQEKGITPWEQVIAISFGEVVCGNVGSKVRTDYTVMGDAVNTASRLESVAKRRNKEVILSEALFTLIPNDRRLNHEGVEEIRGQGMHRVYTLRSPEKNNGD